MSQRKHCSRSEWRALIAEQRASGLTGAAFCQEHGLSAKAFYRQRKRLDSAQPNGLDSTGGFVQIQPAPAAIASKVLALHYRGSRLELSPQVSPHWVAELMRALA